MTNEQKLESLENAYIVKDSGTDNEKVILNDKHPLHDIVRDTQFKLNEQTHAFNLDYSIMNDACMIVANNTENYEEADWYELSQETASVYTGTQLTYINTWNQSDVTDIAKEYDMDIATAAGVWYERQVADACQMLVDAITE